MAKYQLQLKERRTSERKRLTGLMPGRFQINGRQVSARPIDISSNGLGVIVGEAYQQTAQATLTVGDHVMNFEIKWVEQDFGKRDMWRYGLVCTDKNVDVEAVFTEMGCLK